MTTPKQREQPAREAAEAWLERAKGVPELSRHCGYEHEAAIYGYLAGYHAGRFAGMEEAAGICKTYAHSGGVSVMRRQVCYACETRIRAAVAPSQKPPQT